MAREAKISAGEVEQLGKARAVRGMAGVAGAFLDGRVQERAAVGDVVMTAPAGGGDRAFAQQRVAAAGMWIVAAGALAELCGFVDHGLGGEIELVAEGAKIRALPGDAIRVGLRVDEFMTRVARCGGDRPVDDGSSREITVAFEGQAAVCRDQLGRT